MTDYLRRDKRHDLFFLIENSPHFDFSGINDSCVKASQHEMRIVVVANACEDGTTEDIAGSSWRLGRQGCGE